MAIYLGLGLLALFSFAMFGIIDPMLIVYFLVFFLITYLVFGALMIVDWRGRESDARKRSR